MCEDPDAETDLHGRALYGVTGTPAEVKQLFQRILRLAKKPCVITVVVEAAPRSPRQVVRDESAQAWDEARCLIPDKCIDPISSLSVLPPSFHGRLRSWSLYTLGGLKTRSAKDLYSVKGLGSVKLATIAAAVRSKYGGENTTEGCS